MSALVPSLEQYGLFNMLDTEQPLDNEQIEHQVTIDVDVSTKLNDDDDLSKQINTTGDKIKDIVEAAESLLRNNELILRVHDTVSKFGMSRGFMYFLNSDDQLNKLFSMHNIDVNVPAVEAFNQISTIDSTSVELTVALENVMKNAWNAFIELVKRLVKFLTDFYKKIQNVLFPKLKTLEAIHKSVTAMVNGNKYPDIISDTKEMNMFSYDDSLLFEQASTANEFSAMVTELIRATANTNTTGELRMSHFDVSHMKTTVAAFVKTNIDDIHSIKDIIPKGRKKCIIFETVTPRNLPDYINTAIMLIKSVNDDSASSPSMNKIIHNLENIRDADDVFLQHMMTSCISQLKLIQQINIVKTGVVEQFTSDAIVIGNLFLKTIANDSKNK